MEDEWEEEEVRPYWDVLKAVSVFAFLGAVVCAGIIFLGCVSWSQQKYRGKGDEPPHVEHDSWGFSVLGPQERIGDAAEADEIGTYAKNGRLEIERNGEFGYGGGLRAGGAVPAYRVWPFGAPKNRIVEVENITDAWVRVYLNGRPVREWLPPHGGDMYLVDRDHPTRHRLDFCAYESPRGVPIGSWGVTLGTATGRSGWYRLDGGKLKGGECLYE